MNLEQLRAGSIVVELPIVVCSAQRISSEGSLLCKLKE